MLKIPDKLVLTDMEDKDLDYILSLSVDKKIEYFTELAKKYYSNVDKKRLNSLAQCYLSSFYVEKLYRSNAFFREKFTPLYTKTGLIRTIILDEFFAEEVDKLTTH